MLSSSSRWHRAMPWRRHPGLSPPCLLCLWYPFRGGELCPRKCGRVSGSLAASLVTSRKIVHPTGANYPLSICVNHIQHRYGSKIRTQGDSIEYNSRLNHIFSALSIHFFVPNDLNNSHMWPTRPTFCRPETFYVPFASHSLVPFYIELQLQCGIC